MSIRANPWLDYWTAFSPRYAWLSLMLCALAPNSMRAQALEFERRIAPFPVTSSAGDELEFPFLGGFNAPRPQFVDIDGDADLDLFVQEENATLSRPGRLIFFENTGDAAGFRFEYRSDAYRGLDVGNWYRFIDYDGDGDQDLFSEAPFAFVRYWQNVGDSTTPEFRMAADSLRDTNGDLVNFDVGSLPDLADIDCDGDFDLLVGRAAAGTITLYEGLGLDSGGVPSFEEIPGNFQDISIIGEGAPSSSFETGPDFFGSAQEAGRHPFSSLAAAAHGSNSLTIVDIDDDADPDIFWGDLFEPSVVYLRNSGTCVQPNITIQAREFPQAQPLLSSGFNAPRFADIDGDGDNDMFIAVLGGAFSTVSHLVENFLFYRNVGSAARPEFQLQETRLLRMLDIGSNTIPALVDIDADGDRDLFVGNEISADNQNTGRLVFYENTGSPESALLSRANDDVLGAELGFNLAPAFVDIDADGDFDLFTGEWNGKLNFHENTGSRLAADFKPAEPVMAEVDGQVKEVDVGNNNAPAFADIDNDGDFDLVCGEFLGNLNFYENVGSATAPTFVFRTKDFADIRFGLYSVPRFGDVDSDGDLDLFVGSQDDGMRFYRNLGSAANARFEQDSLGIKVLERSATALADLDADGDLDLLSGSAKGGLLFFENRRFVTSVQPTATVPTGFELLGNFPNPFNAETQIVFILPQAGIVNLRIYDLAGRTVRSFRESKQTGTHTIAWDGMGDAGRVVASGVYFYRIQVGRFEKSGRMLLLK